MTYTIEKVLNRYGSTMTLHHNGEVVDFRGFLQPYRSKSLQSTQTDATLLGNRTAGQYVLLAPGDLAVENGDTVSWCGNTYRIKRSEIVMAADVAIYRWCICVKKGGEGIWGS